MTSSEFADWRGKRAAAAEAELLRVINLLMSCGCTPDVAARLAWDMRGSPLFNPQYDEEQRMKAGGPV